MRTAGVLATAVTILVTVAVLAHRARHDPLLIPRKAIAVAVGDVATGRPVPAGFVGLSTEYTSLTAYAGRNPAVINPLFVRLVRNLAPGASPVIRFGGDSTDWTWWPLPGTAKPPWARYVLTPLWIAIARGLADAAHARLILGINFEADSRVLAGAESRALLAGIGRRRIAAFELGNEPEVYGEIGWYQGRSGPVLGRPPSYDFRAYQVDYKNVSSALPQSVPLAGPALALTWPLSEAGRFLSANRRTRLLTFHFYPLKRCFNATSSPTYPTLAHLLAPRSASPPIGTDGAVLASHSRGVAVRVDEFNSVSCKGLPGLSDTFASALWVVDALFGFARAGVDGVNIHTLPDVSYQPFAFTYSAGRWQVQVKPLYYGLLLFDRAAPAGSRLLPTAHPADTALRTWATRGSRGTVRVVLINESASRGVTLTVRPPRTGSSASLELLAAPGLTASSGVTLDGLSYGALSDTARLSGRPSTAILEPVGRRYVVRLPAASAALLTVNAR